MSEHFAWEKNYKRTWQSKNNENKQDKIIDYRININNNTNRVGVIRHLCILIDKSSTIDNNDFLPSFRIVIKNTVEQFIKDFKEENPISTLSLNIITNDIVSNDLTQLDTPGYGTFSLKNALATGISTVLKSSHIREILIISCSLSISNQGELNEILNTLKKMPIKVSFINMCADLSIENKISTMTGGSFHVPIDSHHFQYILNSYLTPGIVSSQNVELVPIAFPSCESYNNMQVCICHFNQIPDGMLFTCVICKSLLCSLPYECPLCKTLNASGSDVSKNSYHSYLMQEFKKEEYGVCILCSKEGILKKCDTCSQIYCENCYIFITEQTGFCMFCD